MPAARKKTTPAKKAPPKKRAPQKRRAPAKKKSPGVEMDVIRQILDRRAISGNLMAASMFGMSAIMTIALIWFQLTTFVAQDERIGRLAAAISTVNTSTNARLEYVERHAARLDEAAKDRWSRANMIEWCLQAEKLNEGFVCPSPIEIAPGPVTKKDLKALSSDRLSQYVPVPSRYSMQIYDN